ncbi:MAG TPA: hypothetical protein VN853_16635 [Polyangia bacterium]|nr:hypothetical protein [Polyangia bacterium]
MQKSTSNFLPVGGMVFLAAITKGPFMVPMNLAIEHVQKVLWHLGERAATPGTTGPRAPPTAHGDGPGRCPFDARDPDAGQDPYC